MILRIRQILTILLLIFFSLENVVPACTDSEPEKYSTKDQVSSHKEYRTIFSWILEETESEERNDNKAHGALDVAHSSITPFTYHLISKVSLRPINSSVHGGSQQILKLIGRLRI